MAGGLALGNWCDSFRWQYHGRDNNYHNVSDYSRNFCGGDTYTSVLVIASPGGLTIFENGKFVLELVRPRAENPGILFGVGYYNSPVDVELSYIRIISGA